MTRIDIHSLDRHDEFPKDTLPSSFLQLKVLMQRERDLHAKIPHRKKRLRRKARIDVEKRMETERKHMDYTYCQLLFPGTDPSHIKQLVSCGNRSWVINSLLRERQARARQYLSEMYPYMSPCRIHKIVAHSNGQTDFMLAQINTEQEQRLVVSPSDCIADHDNILRFILANSQDQVEHVSPSMNDSEQSIRCSGEREHTTRVESIKRGSGDECIADYDLHVLRLLHVLESTTPNIDLNKVRSAMVLYSKPAVAVVIKRNKIGIGFGDTWPHDDDLKLLLLLNVLGNTKPIIDWNKVCSAMGLYSMATLAMIKNDDEKLTRHAKSTGKLSRIDRGFRSGMELRMQCRQLLL